MFIPATFSEHDPEVLTDLIRQYPLGILVTGGVSGLMVSPVPFLHRRKDGRLWLVAHLARANPHWREIFDLKECLVVFKGADNYITPDWYPSKIQGHKVVPTWNYEMITVNGIPTIIEDVSWLRNQVEQMTEAMEEKRTTPWKLADAPNKFTETQIKAIVGLEIEITGIRGKWKMSQNKTREDALGVVE